MSPFSLSHGVSSSAPAAWPLLSLASGDMLKLCPLSDPTPQVFSCREPLVGYPLARNCRNETVEPVECVPLNTARVQAEGKFVNVASKVLAAGLVIDAVHPALHYRPDTLNAVRVDVPTHVHAVSVIDRRVAKVLVGNPAVTSVIVRHNLRLRKDVSLNHGVDRRAVVAVDRLRCSSPATFAHSDNRHLSNGSASLVQFLVFVLVRLQPPKNVSSTSTIPWRISVSLPQASRRR